MVVASAARLRKTHGPTEGGVMLERWIRTHYGSIPAFCEAKGLERIQVQRAVNGERWKRISVNFAIAIEDATGGAVPIRAWGSGRAA